MCCYANRNGITRKDYKCWNVKGWPFIYDCWAPESTLPIFTVLGYILRPGRFLWFCRHTLLSYLCSLRTQGQRCLPCLGNNSRREGKAKFWPRYQHYLFCFLPSFLSFLLFFKCTFSNHSYEDYKHNFLNFSPGEI